MEIQDNTIPRILEAKETLKWSVPVKQIYNGQDVTYFHSSVALERIKSVLFSICNSVSETEVPEGILDDSLVNFKENTSQQNKTLSKNDILDLPAPKMEGSFNVMTLSKPVQSILKILDFLFQLTIDTPPITGPRRYGNMAFRDWHDKLDVRIEGVLAEHLREYFEGDDKQFRGFLLELKAYLVGSFGSRDRIDYGTGHELSFLAFLSGLLMTGILDQEKVTGVEYLVLFSKYYDLMKTLILSYTLEPAGSHGVWGLDDHFHLIYILGASQFVKFSDVRQSNGERDGAASRRLGPMPSSTLNTGTLKGERTRNLYFNAISFIRKVKSGPFYEHSPMLSDISRTKSWGKVCIGMIKMYYVEVLSKFPVVQHFYFGTVLFPWKDSKTLEQLPESSIDINEKEKEEDSQSIRGTTAVNTAMKSIYKKRDAELNTLSGIRKAGESINGRKAHVGNRYSDYAPNNEEDQQTVMKAPWAKK
ncbi:hypothetical protein B5S28_g3843 [[Candida] boidinii]|nr:hypothetical protein B5S28_g3843 [[Candida] boidinii]OWB71715.1 hypothetical protein B5S31_g1408 [[Candida] boidinii]